MYNPKDESNHKRSNFFFSTIVQQYRRDNTDINIDVFRISIIPILTFRTYFDVLQVSKYNQRKLLFEMFFSHFLNIYNIFLNI